MTGFRGNAYQISLGHQTVEGTPVTPTQSFRWIAGTTVDPDKKETEIFEGDGGIDISFVNTDSSMWKGKLVFYPRPIDVGMVIDAVMGTSSEALVTAPTGATIGTAATGGTIAAGTYHYAYCHLYGQVEGPMSADLSQITTGTTSTVTLSSITVDATATKLRIYKGLVGGASGVYSLSADVTEATSVTDTGSAPVFVANTPSGTTGTGHVFTAQTALDFWTIEAGMIAPVSSGSRIRLWLVDCFFTDMTLEAAPNKPLKITAGFIGKYVEQETTLIAPVFDAATKPFITTNVSYLRDGAAELFIDKFKVNYALTVDSSLIYTHVYPETFIMERRKVTADYEILFKDATVFWNFVSGGASTNPTAGTIVDTAAVTTGSLDARFLAGGTDFTKQLGLTVPSLAYIIKPVNPDLTGKPFVQAVQAFSTKPATGAFMTFALRNTQTTAY